MAAKVCGDCAYIAKVEGALNEHCCKRYPPAMQMLHTPQGPSMLTAYPTISPKFDACGEFEEKKPDLASVN